MAAVVTDSLVLILYSIMIHVLSPRMVGPSPGYVGLTKVVVWATGPCRRSGQ